MKIYSFATPSHQEMMQRFFLPSIPNDCELILMDQQQVCPSGDFMGAGWIECMKYKVDLIIRAIHENPGEIFCHADIDITFLNSFAEDVTKRMGDKDMLIQRNSPHGTVCPGFLILKGNEKNLKIWQDIRAELERQSSRNDQTLLNDYLGIHAMMRNQSKLILWLKKIMKKVNQMFKNQNIKLIDFSYVKNAYGLKWDYLPEAYYSYGAFHDRRWNAGMSVRAPKDMRIFHANWTVGIENKMRMLEIVGRRPA